MAYEKSMNKGQAFLTVWSNKTKDGKEFTTYTLEKRYMDGESKWQSTSSFTEADLQNAVVVVQHALSELVKSRGKTDKPDPAQ